MVALPSLGAEEFERDPSGIFNFQYHVWVLASILQAIINHVHAYSSSGLPCALYGWKCLRGPEQSARPILKHWPLDSTVTFRLVNPVNIVKSVLKQPPTPTVLNRLSSTQSSISFSLSKNENIFKDIRHYTT